MSKSKNAIEILASLKKMLFNEDPAQAPANVQATDMVSVKGADGVEYFVEKIEVGAVMNKKNEAGETVPVDAGSYDLEDGTKVTVAQGGVIESIEKPDEAAPAAEPFAEPNTAEQFEKAVDAFDAAQGEDRLNKMGLILRALVKNVFGWQLEEQKRKAEMEEAIRIMQEGFEVMKKDESTKAKFEAIFKAIETISDIPGEESVKDFKATPFKKDDSSIREQLRAAMNRKK